MRVWRTMSILGSVAALATAIALISATDAALARSGAQSGAYQGGGAPGMGGHQAGPNGAGLHRYSRSIRTGGHFHDHDHDRDAHDHDHDHDQAHDHDRDIGYGGDHWAGFLGGDFAGWPIVSLFRRYGDGDHQPCVRRDVYGDLYPGC